jgi:hypothetical protein
MKEIHAAASAATASTTKRYLRPPASVAHQQKFSVPHEIDEILERLPPQVTLNVPDHILSRWFPPRRRHGMTRARARSKLRAKLRMPIRISRQRSRRHLL